MSSSAPRPFNPTAPGSGPPTSSDCSCPHRSTGQIINAPQPPQWPWSSERHLPRGAACAVLWTSWVAPPTLTLWVRHNESTSFRAFGPAAPGSGPPHTNPQPSVPTGAQGRSSLPAQPTPMATRSERHLARDAVCAVLQTAWVAPLMLTLWVQRNKSTSFGALFVPPLQTTPMCDRHPQ